MTTFSEEKLDQKTFEKRLIEFAVDLNISEVPRVASCIKCKKARLLCKKHSKEISDKLIEFVKDQPNQPAKEMR